MITGGSEFNLEVDEPWIWARARRPLVLEIQPAYTTGSVTLTQGSESGTFSSAPSASLEGYFLKLDNGPEIYRIAQHTAASTAFEIDAAFPQTSVSGQAYHAFLTDYDLVGTYITIDSTNDKLDFIETGTTVVTATIAHGSYLPADLATAVASALNSAGTHSNTYTASYDTIQRLFSVTSALNGTGSPIFKPQGAGTNFYRSAWNTLGYDYANASSSGTQTAIYPHSTVIRLTSGGRCYYGNFFNYGDTQGEVTGLDALALEREFPLSAIKAGTPTAFGIIGEKSDGTLRIRINKYPTDKKLRMEFEHISFPKDLQNNAASIPLIPRKFIRILEYGAAFYLLTDKRDTKAQTYFQIAQQTLQSMLKFNRKQLERMSRNFGNVIARTDLMPDKRRQRANLYGYDADII